MAQRMARILGIFTGHGDDIDDLFGTKDSGTTPTRRISQDRFDAWAQEGIVLLGFGPGQALGGSYPAMAPPMYPFAIDP